MNLPPISIVSLNWNSYSELSRLLKSVFNSNYPKSKLEVVVVDNGSTDGSVEKIHKNFPKTEVIPLKKNYGIWTRNVGFKKAKGEIIVVVDSDAILPTKDTLAKVVEKVKDTPNLGILGVKVVNKTTKRPELSPMHLNFYTGVISTQNPDIETDDATWVPFVLAAIPRGTFRKVGLLLWAFAYGDDLNYCLRVREKGLIVKYWPDAYVYHYKTRSRVDVPPDVKYYHYYKAIFRNIFKYGRPPQNISSAIFQLVIIPTLRSLGETPSLWKERWWA